MNLRPFVIASIFGVVFFVLGSFAGFFGGSSYTKKSTLQNLPIVSSVLANPVFYEWWSSAEGVVKEKTANSMILEKNGQTAFIVVMDTTTFAKPKSAGNAELIPASFSDIPLGVTVRGIVRVSKESFDKTLSAQNDRAMGQNFVIVTP